MASVKSVVVFDDYQAGAKRERRYTAVITNNIPADEEHILPPVIVEASDDGTDAANAKLTTLTNIEISSAADITPKYQSQADYDRRALGRAMLIENADEFHAVLPLFEAMELRGGNNAGQRAAYLGVSPASYGDMEERFNNDQGAAFFLDDRKGLIWEDLPPEWE